MYQSILSTKNGKIKEVIVNVIAMIFIGLDFAFSIKKAQRMKYALFANNKRRIIILNPVNRQFNAKHIVMTMIIP